MSLIDCCCGGTCGSVCVNVQGCSQPLVGATVTVTQGGTTVGTGTTVRGTGAYTAYGQCCIPIPSAGSYTITVSTSFAGCNYTTHTTTVSLTCTTNYVNINMGIPPGDGCACPPLCCGDGGVPLQGNLLITFAGVSVTVVATNFSSGTFATFAPIPTGIQCKGTLENCTAPTPTRFYHYPVPGNTSATVYFHCQTSSIGGVTTYSWTADLSGSYSISDAAPCDPTPTAVLQASPPSGGCGDGKSWGFTGVAMDGDCSGGEVHLSATFPTTYTDPDLGIVFAIPGGTLSVSSI